VEDVFNYFEKNEKSNQIQCNENFHRFAGEDTFLVTRRSKETGNN